MSVLKVLSLCSLSYLISKPSISQCVCRTLLCCDSREGMHSESGLIASRVEQLHNSAIGTINRRALRPYPIFERETVISWEPAMINRLLSCCFPYGLNYSKFAISICIHFYGTFVSDKDTKAGLISSIQYSMFEIGKFELQ